MTNTGEASSGVLATAVGGTDKGDFPITENGCMAALGGGKTCTVKVAFKPSSAAPKSANLTVTGMPGGTATANLTGTASSLGIDPPDADYMTVNVNGSAVKTFTIKNNGMAATSPLAATVSATESGITSNTCETWLKDVPGFTCSHLAGNQPARKEALTKAFAELILQRPAEPAQDKSSGPKGTASESGVKSSK